ncbi:NAD-binding protein [Irpex rosettiformis]|uniref:NAD-binding protein n=1 Tax=Irpex rosettiformis TaxID=378272 RepID=A0ACB8UJE9_9APHY|nr:NAD-binding protein [Irpex rosettiformis]
MSHKIVICGAGFLGQSIAHRMLTSTKSPLWRVQLLSRNPEVLQQTLKKSVSSEAAERLEPPRLADITKPNALDTALEGADVVVSAVGIMQGTVADFERIQWKGAENVALAARAAGAKLVHISAIGADESSSLAYARTKGLGEKAVSKICSDATIIRPSIMFGPGDGFFGRFATLSKFLPFMPAFGGGTSRFQPVYVGDVARLVEIIARQESAVASQVDGKIIEAGGPDIFTYRQIMALVLKYTGRYRPIISIPFAIGSLQAMVLEKLPPSILTLTRDQVEQLKLDNVVNQSPSPADQYCDFKHMIEEYGNAKLTSVHEILPKYLPEI